MSATWKDHNFYDLLEVSPNATQREIHDAFKRAKATYSNDNPSLYTMFTKEEAQELLRMIEEAYEILGNHQLRQYYNQKLSQKNPQLFKNLIIPDASQEQQSPMPAPAKSQPMVVEEKSVRFDDGTVSVIRTKSRATGSADGMGQTPIGSYKMDPAMEEEIRTTADFDGPMLQKIRTYKNITLDQLSVSTKVTKSYLEAVERMNTVVLPAPVFVRGFVSHYARILGLDEKMVTDSYMKLYKDSKK